MHASIIIAKALALMAISSILKGIYYSCSALIKKMKMLSVMASPIAMRWMEVVNGTSLEVI
jgi:hypothetical protein